MFALDSDSIYGLLFKQDYNYFLDLENRTARFNDGRGTALLDRGKQYLENGWIFDNSITPQSSGLGIEQLNERINMTRFFYQARESRTLLRELRESAKTGSENFLFNGGGDTANDRIIGVMADSNGNKPFSYERAYAINGNTKNQEAAWAFLKFLAGYDMQISYMRGLPVHTQARADAAKMSISGNIDKANIDKALNNNQQKSYNAYMELIENLLGQINSYEIHDAIIDNWIDAELKKFLEGRQPASDTTANLQNKIGLYLSE